ncbi:hypothetical protein ABZ686_16230 [Streptomyces sp. NPDC006992]|uniref:hypothetical protein n=1 Tax=unclassified Streptomyces TaxID=2593676 RepID=UPI0033E8C420
MGSDGEKSKKSMPGMKPGGHLPRNSDSVHAESKKRTAARYHEETLGPETQKAGAKADEDTEPIAGNPQSPTSPRGKLHGREVWTAVRHRLTVWRKHNKHLTQKLAYEREALLDANKILSGTDLHVAEKVNDSVVRSGRKNALDNL